MSEPVAHEEHAGRPDLRRLGRIAGLLVVIGFAIAFVAQNAQSVKVQFWFFTAHPRLIYVIVGCLVVGAIFGMVIARKRRAARRRRREG